MTNLLDQKMIASRMLDYLPRYYHRSKKISNLLEVESKEVKAVNEAIALLLDQFFVDKATYGLSYWETFLKLPVDKEKPLEYRRNLIKSKLQGIGVVNKAYLMQVARAIFEVESNGSDPVEITELYDKYTIQITILFQKGKPAKINLLDYALQELIPAHLKIEYVYQYTTWEEVDNCYFVYGHPDGETDSNVDPKCLSHITWEQFQLIFNCEVPKITST
ncbi:putative phage tail protein [Longirhabdus pacifica]|uniref:putative phage tail protein n=1 Tax=Longirhabdus pacifica TaxID=2305227 RepID=UPI001008AB99|nr:putative phage tail protein [Longirhabdus pacifica]